MPRFKAIGIGARSDGFHAFAEDGLRQDSRGRGSVARDVAGLRGHFLEHLRAHVFNWIFEFDFLRNGNPVLGNQGRTEFLVEYRVPSFRSQRDLDRFGKCIDAAQNRLTRIFTMYDLFCHR